PWGDKGRKPARVGSATKVTGVPSPRARPSVGSPWAGSNRNHRPALLMPTGMTSYRVRSMAFMMERADRRETSCSPDLPPNKTATRRRSAMDGFTPQRSSRRQPMHPAGKPVLYFTMLWDGGVVPCSCNNFRQRREGERRRGRSDPAAIPSRSPLSSYEGAVGGYAPGGGRRPAVRTTAPPAGRRLSPALQRLCHRTV